MSEYPKLMRYLATGVIVKFTSHETGTIVGVGHTGSGTYYVGYHSDEWNEEVFSDYNPEIFETRG